MSGESVAAGQARTGRRQVTPRPGRRSGSRGSGRAALQVMTSEFWQATAPGGTLSSETGPGRCPPALLSACLWRREAEYEPEF